MALGDFFKGSSEPPTQQSVDRRRRIAQALASVAQQGLQGQQVGRYYNAPSTGATIAGALSQIVGGYQSGKAEQEQKTVDEDRKRKIAEALAKVQGGQQNQAAMEALGTLPIEQQEAALSQGVSAKLFSKPKDPIKVGAGDVLLDAETKQPVYTAPSAPQKKPGEIGSLNPGDYTPASLAKYQTSGNFADLERAYAPTKPEAPASAQLVTRPLPDGNVQDFAFDPRTRQLSPVGQPYKDPKAGAQGGNVTGEERTAAYLGARLDGALQDIARYPAAGKPEIDEKLGSMVGEGTANFFRSPERRQINASQLDALDAALTLATGAAYTKEQLESQRVSYFPQINDDEATVADKQRRFEALVQAARIKAGRAAPQIDQANAQRASPEDWQNGNTAPQAPRSRVQAADPFMGRYLPQ